MESSIGNSILEHFSSLTDPRIKLKTRHKLLEIVAMTLCAMIAGADDWVEIADFAKEKEGWLKKFLKLPNGTPSHDTFGRVFSLINPEEFGTCFITWLKSLFPVIDSDIIAVDGKTARRSHDRANGQKPIHMVSAWAVNQGLVLGQVKTEEKSNEITAIPELLRTLDLKSCVITIDAMGAQTKITKQIIEQEGDYVISLKGNQGILNDEVRQLFEDAEKNGYDHLVHSTHTTVDGEHGRIETRRCVVTNDIDWYTDKSKWAGLNTFAMIESTRDLGNKIENDTRFFISSLPMDAERLLEVARGHWAVENSLHWCLDISFREDDCRVRKKNAPENLAILRRFALNLIKNDPTRKVGVKASRKRAGWSLKYLEHLLGLK
jgi:predicted transposase YbfD/YdcC